MDNETWKKNIGHSVEVLGVPLTIATAVIVPLFRRNIPVLIAWVIFCTLLVAIVIVHFMPFVSGKGADHRALKFIRGRHPEAYLESGGGQAKLDGWYWHVIVSYYEQVSEGANVRNEEKRVEVLVNAKCGNVSYAYVP
jgi:hypothetical protein